MLVELKSGKSSVTVNPAHIRSIRPSWSSSDVWPRTEIVLGAEWGGLLTLFGLLVPRNIVTVDGTVRQVTEAINRAPTRSSAFDLEEAYG